MEEEREREREGDREREKERKRERERERQIKRTSEGEIVRNTILSFNLNSYLFTKVGGY